MEQIYKNFEDCRCPNCGGINCIGRYIGQECDFYEREKMNYFGEGPEWNE